MRYSLPAMACCLRSRGHSDKDPFILDVEQIMQDYVWAQFKAERPPWQQLCLKRKDFVVDVPMNYFHFDKLREEVRPRQKPDPAPIPQPQPSLVSGMTHVPRDIARNPLLTNSNVMALSTEFTNRTDKDQTYKFRFEKTRKASLNVTFQRGFSIGGKVNFSLGLPKVMADGKVGGEVDMRVSVSKSTGEVIEETLTWEATSEINVANMSNYKAKVLLSEAPVSYNFKMWTKMSMPTGAAAATVRRKNNDSFRYVHTISNLKQVFQKYEGGALDFLEEQLSRDTKTYAIVFKTTGIVDGVRLSDQKILLEGKDLAGRASFPGGSFGPGHFRNSLGDVSPSEFTLDGCHGNDYLVPQSSRAGRVPQLAAPSHPPPPPIPMIEEMPEDDGGVGEPERPGGECHSLPHVAPARANCAMIGQLPRITTTTPSSQASSPLSDTGSPDMSESSKKSETITTV